MLKLKIGSNLKVSSTKVPFNYKNIYSIDLKSEEAFKIVDIDFDGNIGKGDLRSFLREILHIP